MTRPDPELAELIRSGDERFWRAGDLPAAHARALGTLRALAAAGELERKRPGLYWHGRETRFGRSVPSTEQWLDALLPGVVRGATGPSAANALGLSTQVPARVFLAVCARPVTAPRLLVLRDRSAATARQAAELNGFEVALLEVLRDDRWVEDSPAAATLRLRKFIDAGYLRAERLRAAAATEPTRARARLRELLGD